MFRFVYCLKKLNCLWSCRVDDLHCLVIIVILTHARHIRNNMRANVTRVIKENPEEIGICTEVFSISGSELSIVRSLSQEIKIFFTLFNIAYAIGRKRKVYRKMKKYVSFDGRKMNFRDSYFKTGVRKMLVTKPLLACD